MPKKLNVIELLIVFVRFYIILIFTKVRSARATVDAIGLDYPALLCAGAIVIRVLKTYIMISWMMKINIMILEIW